MTGADAAAIAADIDRLRGTPGSGDLLAELLPENLPLYAGLPAAEVTRLRGYLLAAFADAGLPPAALPYVVESLETGMDPDEVAGAAIALRGLDHPAPELGPLLMRALDRLGGADRTISFESYRPDWPYARPTTVVTEVVRTIDQLAGDDRAWPDASERSVREPAAAELPGRCCHHDSGPQAGRGLTATEVMLQDQDGDTEAFSHFFRGKPAVLAFFYTRCENPYKCSLTVSKLAALQRALVSRELAGAVRVAAVTYDPEFDLPHRLKRYGEDRGVRFDADTRFFRTVSGFPRLRDVLGLGVNYGGSTVNRHRVEVYVLDRLGEVSASFTREQWRVETVLETLLGLRAPAS